MRPLTQVDRDRRQGGRIWAMWEPRQFPSDRAMRQAQAEALHAEAMARIGREEGGD